MNDDNPLIGGTHYCRDDLIQMTAAHANTARPKPTEVRMIDVLIEVRTLRGEIHHLKKRVEELENRPRLPRICK